MTVKLKSPKPKINVKKFILLDESDHDNFTVFRTTEEPLTLKMIQHAIKEFEEDFELTEEECDEMSYLVFEHIGTAKHAVAPIVYTRLNRH